MNASIPKRGIWNIPAAPCLPRSPVSPTLGIRIGVFRSAECSSGPARIVGVGDTDLHVGIRGGATIREQPLAAGRSRNADRHLLDRRHGQHGRLLAGAREPGVAVKVFVAVSRQPDTAYRPAEILAGRPPPARLRRRHAPRQPVRWALRRTASARLRPEYRAVVRVLPARRRCGSAGCGWPRRRLWPPALESRRS